MAYNLLSGTVVANESVVFEPATNGSEFSNVIVGQFKGDGQQLQNVARVVANGTTDYLVSIGANADSLVGEPNLRFNGSRLLVNGQVTASTMQLTSLSAGQATTSSFLALDSNNNVVLTSSAGGPDFAIAQGPINSLQFHSSPGDISGSANITFSNNTLFVTGTLVVSGNVEAHSFDLVQTTLVEINQSGSTTLGNSNDDTHHFTGSISVFSSSTDLFAVDVENKRTKIKTGLVFNRTAVATNYSVLVSDYYVGIDTATPTAAITASLPAAESLQSGQTFVFKDEGGSAHQYGIMIKASGSQKIDNQNQVFLESPHASLTIYTDGASKFFIT
jgi:hypothetical protein